MMLLIRTTKKQLQIIWSFFIFIDQLLKISYYSIKMNGRLLSNAGIFIPTMNRVDFVIRQLHYYSSVGCPHTIYIGDSSSKEESEKIADEIQKLGDKIKAKYYYLPRYSSWQAHLYLITQVEEEYICYSGDDDYQIPNTVTKCIEFLQTNPEYTTASGHAVSFRLKESGPYGNLERLSNYPRRQIEDNTARERIINFFNKYYVTHFSVNRTQEMIKYWQSSEKIKEHHFQSEILPTSMPLIYGKSKIIDALGFIRQMHNRRITSNNTYDWLISPEWNEAYKIFEGIMAKNISEKDNISREEGVKIIKQAVWAYLKENLSKEYEIYNPIPKKENQIKYLAHDIRSKTTKMFPFLKQIYRMHIKPKIKGGRELNFEVLQPNSEYYRDFKPVMDSFKPRE